MESVTSENSQQLIEQYKKFVDRVVRKFMTRMNIPEVHEGDLISAGYLGLVEAAARYDESRGINFKTFSYLRIRGAVIDALRGLSDLSSSSYTYLKVLDALAESREELDKEITESETRTEMLGKIMDYAAKGALAYRMSIATCEEEATYYSDHLETPETIFEREENRKFLREKIGELPQKEREIIENFYFQDRSFAEIADDNVSLSKSWISRLHARGLTLLKDACIAAKKKEKEEACSGY